jgi:hypothetical protein
MDVNTLLYGDIFNYHILNQLNPITLYSLCQTCKRYKSIIKKKHFEKATIAEIKKRLLEGQLDLDTFLERNKSNGVVFFGSFIIQCILDEIWNDSAIDICLPSKTKVSIDSRGRIPSMEIKNDLSGYYRNYKEIGTRPSCRWHVSQLNSHDNVQGFVKKVTDFDICKNIYWYDGEDHIYVHSFNQILSKRTNFNCKEKLLGSIERYGKYKKRGFTFDNIPNNQDIHLYKVAMTNKQMLNRNGRYDFGLANYELVDGNLNLLVNKKIETSDCKNPNCIMKVYASHICHFHGQIINMIQPHNLIFMNSSNVHYIKDRWVQH